MRYLSNGAVLTAMVALICWYPATGTCLLSTLTVSLPLQKADAIVVLAGSYQERCSAAAALFKGGYVKRIVLTDDNVRRGWSRHHQRNLYSIERSEEILLGAGVPQGALVRLPFSKCGTIYDALAVRAYLKSNKLQRIILVTSDYHSRRTLWIFQKVLRGLPVEIGIIPAHSTDLRMLDLFRECVKSVYYALRFTLGAEPTLSG